MPVVSAWSDVPGRPRPLVGQPHQVLREPQAAELGQRADPHHAVDRQVVQP